MKNLWLIFCLLFHLLSVRGGERVVSLSPAVSEAVIAIGGKALLCGRSSACNIPEISHLPAAGTLGKPLPEKIFQLRCTLLVSDTRHPSRTWLLLQKSPVKVLLLPAKRLDDLPGNLRKLGRALQLEKNAEKTASKFEEQLAALRRTVPERKSKALIIFSTSPAVSCGRESFITEALSLAGFESITGNMPGAYFTVSQEFILQSKPDHIISAGLPLRAVQKYFARPVFRDIPAVKNGSFICADTDRLCRLGINLPQAIRQLRDKHK